MSVYVAELSIGSHYRKGKHMCGSGGNVLKSLYLSVPNPYPLDTHSSRLFLSHT